MDKRDFAGSAGGFAELHEVGKFTQDNHVAVAEHRRWELENGLNQF